MSDKSIWQLLKEEYRNDPTSFGGSSDDTTIEDAQQALGIKFSQEYIQFLELYGAAVMPGYIIYGLQPVEGMSKSIRNVIDKTNFYRAQKWPGIKNWYIISDDGCGNPIGVDNGGKVWLSDHDCAFDKVKLAESFEEFMAKILTKTLYD